MTTDDLITALNNRDAGREVLSSGPLTVLGHVVVTHRTRPGSRGQTVRIYVGIDRRGRTRWTTQSAFWPGVNVGGVLR